MRAFRSPRSGHGGLVLPWRTLLLTGFALVLYWLAGPAPEALVYDRSAIADGEWWRLITGHLVHSDANHALWDIAALAVLGALFERRLGPALTASLLAGSFAIDAWLWWAMPSLERYCGLSGAINALLAAGLWRLWRGTRDPVVLLLGASVFAKIAVEVAIGQMLFTDTAWPGVPSVHAVGFAAGILLSQLRGRTRFSKPGRLIRGGQCGYIP